MLIIMGMLVVIVVFLWDSVGTFKKMFLNFIIGNFQSCFSLCFRDEIRNPEYSRIPSFCLKHASETGSGS
jgi:hypothetical protein